MPSDIGGHTLTALAVEEEAAPDLGHWKRIPESSFTLWRTMLDFGRIETELCLPKAVTEEVFSELQVLLSREVEAALLPIYDVLRDVARCYFLKQPFPL